MIGNALLASAAAQLDPVDAILDAVRAHFGMEIAFASRFVGERRQFTHIRTELPVPHRPGDSEPNQETYCWHIVQGTLPELIHDAADYPLAQTLPITNALPVGCHMDVPIRLRDGSLYGTFCCLSRGADRTLTARDLSAMRAFADLAAVQIEGDLDRDRGRASIVTRVETAIADSQLGIVLQPVFRLGDGLPVGVEALARFPDAGSRPPSDWFAEAADHGLGEALELAAVRAALLTLPYVPAPHYLAINVSPAVAASPALRALLMAQPAGRILLEITEHEAVADGRVLRRALAPLAGHVRLAIDDVGAGYAGLRQILELRPDVLKLDIALVRDVDRDPARHALIEAMVRFAAHLGAQIVAEGVEREGERAVLAALGVDYVQGWLFSRALPPVAAQQLLLGRTEPVPARRPGRRRAA